jgi:hypothetical protein
MAMDFASILSKEYFETMMKKGTPNAADVIRSARPFEFVTPEGRDDPQGIRSLLAPAGRG